MIKTFSDFWTEVREPYLQHCLQFVWLFPLAVILGGFVVRGMQCFSGLGPSAVAACADLAQPLDFLARAGVLFIFLPIAYVLWFGYSLLLEWFKYRKDEPSYFTHSKGCEGPPGYTRRLKLVNGSTLQIEEFVLQAEVIAAGHKRYAGDFTEAQLLRYLKRRFARTENKPSLEASDHLQWRIRQNNGNEVGVDLKRAAGKPTTWTLRTEFYQWAGRKSPPTLVETHITEFVPLQ